MSTNKSFIERCVQFEEEPLAVVEVGEASSPPEPLKVSEEFVEHADSDLYDGYEFISDPKIPTRPKWAAKTLHAKGEIAGDPNDPRRTRSQFEVLLQPVLVGNHLLWVSEWGIQFVLLGFPIFRVML